MPVKVKWDNRVISLFLKNDKSIEEELMKAGNKVAAKNNQAALKYHHKPLPGATDGEMYSCSHRRLIWTQAAVVHSNNKIAAAIGRKYGYPKKYKV